MGSVINAQNLFNRARMWLAGLQFAGKRDLYEQFGYERRLTNQHFVAAYYRQGLAKRVNDAPALATWSDPPQLKAENEEFNKAWEVIVEQHNLWHHVIRLDKLVGLGQYALLLVGFDDGRPLDQPVTVQQGRKVLYLQPYHEQACSIQRFDVNKSSARYMKPEIYNINPGRLIVEGMQSSLSQGQNAFEVRQPFNVHYSRVVHVAEGLLEDNLFGIPRLEAVYNDLCDMLKIAGGSAEVFWLCANRGMQVDIDKEMELDEKEAADLEQEIQDYMHQLRRFIRTRGVKIESLGSDAVDPRGAYNVTMELIATATGIPISVLTGSGGGKLVSQQDRANWSQRIAERVTDYAHPIVLRGLLACLIEAGVLPVPVSLDVQWPEAFKLNALERAQTSAQMARSAANLSKAHVQLSPKDENGNPLPSAAPLFEREEMRRMVSFGKHPPVFDLPQPSGNIPPPGDPFVEQ